MLNHVADGKFALDRVEKWCFKYHVSRKIFAEIHVSRGLIFLTVMRVSQSQFFHKPVLQNRFLQG